MAKPQFVTKRELEAVKKDLHKMMRETLTLVRKMLKPVKTAKKTNKPKVTKLPKRKKR